MREGRIALRDRRNAIGRNPRIEKRCEQPGDRNAVPFAVAKHLRYDHAQSLVEHAAQRAVHATPLVVRRVQKEAGAQEAILSREKTIDRSRPPRSRLGELAASLRRRIEDGGAARSQTLETTQFRTLPSRPRNRYGLRVPALSHQLARVVDLLCNPVPGTRWKHLRRQAIKGHECLVLYSKTQICVVEERPGERYRFGILRQTYEIIGNAAHLERLSAVAGRKKCGDLTFKTPRSTVVGQIVHAARSQQPAGVPSDRSNRLGPPPLKMAPGDAASSRQLRVGRVPLKICVEDRHPELFRPLVVAGERRFDDSLERVNRIRHSSMPADRSHQRRSRQSVRFPDAVQ